nr:hypothetical protein [Tanacetum cinerariifolium]
ASRRHVAASYWTAASDVAATSAPVNGGHRRSTPPATGQRRVTVVIGGQRWRSTTVNAADHRSTVAVNDGRRWRTTVDCRWTTVDHHRTTGQRWLVGRSTSGSGPVWIGSGPGPGRVWAGSATWHATCQPRVNTCQPPTWQLPIGQPPVTWQPRQHRSTAATVGQRRSTPLTTGQRWRSTTVAGGEPPLTAAGPPLTTTEPPVNGGWWAGQRAGLGRSGSGLGWVRVGSGSGPPRVSHVCRRGIHVAADVDNKHTWESNSGPHGWNLSQNQEKHCARQWSQ